MKACPFCGCHQWQVVEYQPSKFRVMCKNCGATGPTGDSQGTCIVEWNNRKLIDGFKKAVGHIG